MDESLVLFESSDGVVSFPVEVSHEDVWLTRAQMGVLFDRNVKTIGKHVKNALSEELGGDASRVVAKFATTAADGKVYMTEHYSLDVIISVGYRVKSQRGIEFRRWATDVLHRYIVDGRAENEHRLKQLEQVIGVLGRVPDELDSRQVLDVIKGYTRALDLLDDYDHQCLAAPTGDEASHVLTYAECRDLIGQMRFGSESSLFGVEKDESFKGSIGNIYQTFAGEEIYPSLEEKAANLLYLITKNHSFLDGNKRVAAAVFLCYLEKNGVLVGERGPVIDNNTLVAITIMIAESRPEEKDAMVALVMNFLAARND